MRTCEMTRTLKSGIVIKYKNKGQIAIWLDRNRCEVFGKRRLLASCYKVRGKGQHDPTQNTIKYRNSL